MQRPFAHVAGLGVHVPERVVTNRDFEQRLETSDQWIVERTGIRERRVAGPEETVATMARGAAETALGRAAILRTALTQPLTKRAIGFGVGDIFGDRRWDGPFLGPVLDASWVNTVNPEDLWIALN